MLNPAIVLAVSTALLIWHRKTLNRNVVEGGKISSSYLKYRGKRTGKAVLEHGEDIYHLGVDIKASKGSKIRSINDGKILAMWPDGKVSGYGNTIIIVNKDGTGALYAHMNRFSNIRVGQEIKKGEVIGYVGQTQSPRPEMKTAPHLHLEVLKLATKHINPSYPPRLDPVKYLYNQGMRV